MFIKRRKPTLEEIGNSIKSTIFECDSKKIKQLFEDLRFYYESQPTEVEAYMGFAILLCIDTKFVNIEEHIRFFLEKFPHSISPVRVEYAGLLAENNHQDLATHYCREYLFDLRHSKLFDKISEMDIARKGAGRAFLIITCTYTKLGARSYSRRILDFALSNGAFNDFKEAYIGEKQALDKELMEEKNKKLDMVWEKFFQCGEYGEKLVKWCDKNNCPKMAKRTELIWEQYRFDKEYKVGTSEILKHVKKVKVKTSDNKIEEAWALI